MNTNDCGEIRLANSDFTHINPGFSNEWERIRFLIERDGFEAAQEWCRNTIKIYRTAVLDRGNINRKPHYASCREFKKNFILSYLDFKKFISNYG